MEIIEATYGSSLYEASKRLRDDILRKPIGLTLSARDLEGEENQIHIVTISGDEVQATVILKPLSTDTLQLRQMAVANELQGQGLGKKMVLFAEDVARTRHYATLKVKARLTAQVFYEKLGYIPVGDIFNEVNLHTMMMYKHL